MNTRTRFFRTATVKKFVTDDPHFLGLQNGDVKNRWIDRQPLVDRVLMQCVWVMTIVVGVTALGLWLL